MPKNCPRPVPRLDLRGLRCPLPVLKAGKAMRGLAPGALLEILADDPGALEDFRDFCAANAHRLVEATHYEERVFRLVIRKGAG